MIHFISPRSDTPPQGWCVPETTFGIYECSASTAWNYWLPTMARKTARQ